MILRILSVMWIFVGIQANAEVGEMMSFQYFQGDTYSVICNDGTKESITGLDLKVDNLCPRKDLNRANKILALHHLANGTFEVVCVDLTRHNASAEEVLRGEICTGAIHLDVVGDILSGQSRADGNFDLICDNGAREVVSPRDLRLDNVCPKVNLVDPAKKILSATNVSPNSYLILCDNKAKKTVSGSDLKNPDICGNIAPPGPKLKEGNYNAESSNSFFCKPYRIVNTKYENGILLSFFVTCPNGDQEDADIGTFTCNANSTSCSGPSGRMAKIMPNSQIDYTASGYRATLSWVSPL